MSDDKWIAGETNISEDEGEEILPIPHSFSSDSVDSTVAVPSMIKTVREFKKLEKLWTWRVARCGSVIFVE